MDGGVSGWLDVVSGVPPGSVLVPILFVLYTSLLSHVADSQVYCYADDTTLVAPIQRPSLRAAFGDVLNDDIAKVVDWCERWDMKLNQRKSKSLLVSIHPSIGPSTPVRGLPPLPGPTLGTPPSGAWPGCPPSSPYRTPHKSPS